MTQSFAVRLSADDSYSAITYTVEDGAAIIYLDRPEKLNAQSTRLLAELDQAIAAAVADDEVATIALLATGAAFSAGHDVNGDPSESNPDIVEIDRKRFDGTLEGLWEYECKVFYQYALNMHDCPKPLIAGVQGHLAVAGVMLAAMCDLIIAADDAKFQDHSVGVYALAMPEVGWHPYEIGVRKAKEFLWTGGVWDALTMERLGLVNRVVPRADLEFETISVAKQIAKLPRFTLMLSKRSLNQAADLMGKRNYFEHHFILHELSHCSRESQGYGEIRGSMSSKEWLTKLRARVGFVDPRRRPDADSDTEISPSQHPEGVHP